MSAPTHLRARAQRRRQRMPSKGVSALPLIDYWGASRIESAVNLNAAGGALVGILLSTPLNRLATIASGIGREWGGALGANAAWYVGWALSVYACLLVIAHWNQLEDEDGE